MCMKVILQLRTYQLTILLITLFSAKLISQPSTIFTPVFEEQTKDLTRRVFVQNNRLIFEINNSVISNFDLEGKPFTFLEGVDKKSYALIKYYFGQKSEKSSFELYLLDENFSVSFYRKFEFYYEEPLPKILVLASTQFLFLYPASGKVKVFLNSKETEIDLLKHDEQEFDQERIGHLIAFEGQILVSLSQLNKNGKLYSKILILNPETLETNSFEIDLSIIYKVFVHNSEIYFTGIETEPDFKTGFYLLKFNDDKLNSTVFEKISDEFIEDRVKNSEDLFFSRDCIYSIKNKSLERTSFCLDNETILDAISTFEFTYVLTRKELKSNLYTLDKEFKVIEKANLERYLTNPELKISFNKKLYLIDRNKTILVKNFSEE